MRLERRIDEQPQRAARLQDRAVARVLRQERPLAFATRLQSNAGTSLIGKEPNVHWLVFYGRRYQGFRIRNRAKAQASGACGQCRFDPFGRERNLSKPRAGGVENGVADCGCRDGDGRLARSEASASSVLMSTVSSLGILNPTGNVRYVRQSTEVTFSASHVTSSTARDSCRGARRLLPDF